MKKAYIVYLDDGENCYKVNIVAEDEAHAREYVKGNGDIISVKLNESRTPDCPISLDYIRDALRNACFGKVEIDLVTRALNDCEFIL